MEIKGLKSKVLVIILATILTLATSIQVMANTAKVAKTKAWDTIENLGGKPKSVKKIEYAGSVFYLGTDVTDENFLTVIATGPEAVKLQSAEPGKLYAYPIYILWNKEKTTLLVHPITYKYDDVLEEISVKTATPTSLKETSVKKEDAKKDEAKKEPVKPGEKPKETIFFEEVTLLSSDELKALIEIAPTHLETKSKVKMTKTKMSDKEIKAWGEEYLELGGINSFELEVVRLINEERAKYKLKPLAIMPHYMQAARLSSQEMSDLDYMAHISPVYENRGAFIAPFGRNMGGSETITGSGNPESALNAWLTSTKGHREILLSNTTAAIGVGFVNGRTTALFISGDRQYIGYEITVDEYLKGERP